MRLLLSEDLPPPAPAGRSPASDPTATMATFDSSMAVTMLVLLAVLFLMAAFSLYIRRFARENPPAAGRGVRLRGRNLRGAYLLDQPPASAHVGTDPAVVAAMPVFAYRPGAKVDECAVCLAEFEAGEAVKVIPACRHCFHRECIDEWLAWRCSCPLCRTTRMSVPAGKAGMKVCVEVFDEMAERGFTGEGSSESADGGLRRSSSCASLGEGSPGSPRRSCSF